jgi:hypothetical protein
MGAKVMAQMNYPNFETYFPTLLFLTEENTYGHPGEIKIFP